MDKRYPLEIENIGEDVYVLMSRGHHDVHEFMAKVRDEGYDWPLGMPKHVWMKTRPSRDPGYHCFYDAVPKGTRGAWPATHVQEAWGDECYESLRAAAPARSENIPHCERDESGMPMLANAYPSHGDPDALEQGDAL